MITRKEFLTLIGAGALGVTAIPLLKSLPNFAKPAQAVTATEGAGPVYPMGSNPLGVPMSEWVTRWSQWAFAFKDIESPILDRDGQMLMKAQPQGEAGMFLLTGGYGVNRKVKMPYGTSIMIPVLNGNWGYSELDYVKDDEQLKQLVRQEEDSASILEATLNGNILPYYRIDSNEIFYMFYEDSPYYGTKKGLTRAFADGYYVFLKPLARGVHTIYVHGRLESALVGPARYDNKVMHFVEVV